jgi:hypothetical protein
MEPSITFSIPVWQTANKQQHYNVTIAAGGEYVVVSPPQYIDLSGSNANYETPDEDVPSFNEVTKKFITALIEKDKQASWFSTKLKEASVLRKLTHVWETARLDTAGHESGWYLLNWKPTSLKIKTDGFILVWSVVRIEATTPQISPRFLHLSEPPSPAPEKESSPSNTIRQITLQAGAATSTSDELMQVYDIPFSNENTAAVFEEQIRDKQVVQEARLRLALAKLKAERLEHKYSKKYGEYLEDEGDEDEDEDEEGEEEM